MKDLLKSDGISQTYAEMKNGPVFCLSVYRTMKPKTQRRSEDRAERSYIQLTHM